ncbi:MAG TPA: class I SAM-dependent methyltransferase [Myxococcales bacterium]|nr:class I SAM-dependent methyltransferase [Myxococcales bacterium]
MNVAEKIHAAYGGRRRIEVLSHHIEKFLPHQGSLLDVGCGDGALARRLGESRPDLRIRGIDVRLRPDALIPVDLFDGKRIPHPDDHFDCVLLADVLHHCEPPDILLGEAARVARRKIVIKDHLLEGWLAGPTLRLMDRVGNARHGVSLPFTYWREARWRTAWHELGLELDAFEVRLHLYPPPLGFIFDRGLHFIAELRPS